MGKIYRILIHILKFFCLVFIAWFAVYFLLGDRFSIYFTDRVFASWFPQILVFLAAASIYGIFILEIKSSRKKWQNILLFIGGFFFALIPFLTYHGYFQYQNGFWNKKNVQSEILYFNSSDDSETIKILEYQLNEESKSDTVFSKQITPYFEIQNPVKIEKGENSGWKLKK